MLFTCIYWKRDVTVSEHGQCLYADIQPDMHDAANWTLVGVSSVFGADASGIPF